MVEKYGGAWESTDDNIALRMRVPCWITTDTYSEYVILTDFQLQQWWSERALNVTLVRTLPPLSWS